MNIDFQKYTDAAEVIGFNLFIDPDGFYYKINKISNKVNVIDHNLWALAFFKGLSEIYESERLSPAEVVVHKCGFLYYSHDMLMKKPIVKISNPKYYNNRVTKYELDSLVDVMIFNHENPFNVPMVMGEEGIYDYVELDGKVYKKGGLR